jgi:hypothetical protein
MGGTCGCIEFDTKLLRRQCLDNGKVTMACDCLSAMCGIFEHDFDKPSHPHFDLVQICRLHLANSPAAWQPRHACGHQDDHHSSEDLDTWERNNIDMGNLAKTSLDIHAEQPTTPLLTSPQLRIGASGTMDDV